MDFGLTIPHKWHTKDGLVGTWLSLVEHSVRDAGVARSNRAVPTTSLTLQLISKNLSTVSQNVCHGFGDGRCGGQSGTVNSQQLNHPVCAAVGLDVKIMVSVKAAWIPLW